jgi:protein gp37
MATDTKIQWTAHSASPWYGCQHKVDADGTPHPGCLNCYAETNAGRNPGTLGVWGPNGTRVASKSFHANCKRWNAKAAKERVRQSVFPSICDPFEDWQGPISCGGGDELCICDGCGKQVLFTEDCEGDSDLCRKLPRKVTMNDLRAEMFATIDACPLLDFLLLTKRPENVRSMWPVNELGRWDSTGRDLPLRHYRKNVQLLYSASDQASLEAGIGELLKCRDLVPVIGLSLEPLVGPITFRWASWNHTSPENHLDGLRQLDWVIIGGESGHGARPCHVANVREILAQCKEAGVPCFVKQLGSSPRPSALPSDVCVRFIKDKKGGDWNEWPADLRVREFPKAQVFA